ncbi:MAG TPA: hypothetical protein VGF60_22865 [Xanthobacteraceae bacterium]
MLDRIGEPFGIFDLPGAVSVPGWLLAVGAVFAAGLGVLALVRASHAGRSETALRVLFLLLFAAAGWLVLDRWAEQERRAEQRELEARAFELAAHAQMPGSGLACLDAMVGDTIEDACENALFGSPEKAAAAVSYVAAQLSLLAYARDHGDHGVPPAAIAHVRKALEADRFGVAAHVLATRDGCTPERCAGFFLLSDASQVRANLVSRAFDARMKSHVAGWGTPTGAQPHVEASPGIAGAKTPNGLYFPSASSIPPVNIMTAEPAPPARNPAAAAEATPPRKPSPPPAPARSSSGSSAPARSAPLPLAPNPAD